MFEYRLRHSILTRLISAGLGVGLSAAACGGESTGDTDGGAGAGGTAGTGGTGGSGGFGGSAGSSGGGVGGGGTTSADAGFDAAPDVDVPECSFGTARERCFTVEEANWIADNPPMGGDAPPEADGGAADGGPTDGGPPLLCPAASEIQDDCCNPATSGPVFDGTLCCYVFCEGGCCGRPFLVDGNARVACLVPSSRERGWATQLRPAARAAYDDRALCLAAQEWRGDGLMEHASVAAFARFTAQLLALRAPKHLIASSQRALRDEVQHARLCFALARELDGDSLEPGVLRLEGTTRNETPSEILLGAIWEGCVEETIAACVAAEQFRVATHPATRDALRRIAEDEASHAALAWEFVAWLLKQHAGTLLKSAERAFSAALAERTADFEAPLAPQLQAELAELGRLRPSEVKAVRERALRCVIAPCWAALRQEFGGQELGTQRATSRVPASTLQ